MQRSISQYSDAAETQLLLTQTATQHIPKLGCCKNTTTTYPKCHAASRHSDVAETQLRRQRYEEQIASASLRLWSGKAKNGQQVAASSKVGPLAREVAGPRTRA
eukprot:scaffold72660_cov16-Tisochrysis_lutea.AAC.1